MKAKTPKKESFEELDRQAHDLGDIHPLSPALRAEWNLALKTRAKFRARAAAKKDGSRIVPVALEAALLAKADRYAKAAGMTRSRLVAEALLLRMKS
jgi:rRNA maturation endonuclease Nob1